MENTEVTNVYYTQNRQQTLALLTVINTYNTDGIREDYSTTE